MNKTIALLWRNARHIACLRAIIFMTTTFCELIRELNVNTSLTRKFGT
jgi:hypothetical protein